MVISREPKTCFKLKSGSSKKPVLIIGRWGIKENKRSREGCFRDFYTYNSFFPLENNELVKLIFNSEPPHTLTWTGFQAFEFYTIFAFLSPLCVTAIVDRLDRKIDYYFSIAIYKFPFFATWIQNRGQRSGRRFLSIETRSPFHEVAFSRLAPLNRETAGRRRIEGGEGAEG